ncbi:hypothetical protein ACH40F_20530 [Streptomyces sp. NPDC020794]|uniref:hypothetical protein n=1 Tax=unclassified Streptomyces TaxID=2593676 RepID=UPI0036F1535F
MQRSAVVPDKNAKAVGSVEGVFSAAAHQLLADEALYSADGRCGTSFRLALALRSLVHLKNSSTAWTECVAYVSAGQHHAQ